MILNHFKIGIKIAATKKQKVPKFGKEVENCNTFFERIINATVLV